MHKIKQEIITILKQALKTENIDLEIPPNSDFGDYTLHCYKLAKSSGKDPKEITNVVIENLKKSKFVRGIKQIGPYINFFINKQQLAKLTLEDIYKEKEKYGSSNLGKNKKILIEHTSINPNASPHVGRARNAIIGDSITRILRFQGYDVETHYLVNDVGKQIAMLVFGCKGKKVNFDSLLKIYVDINKKIEENPELGNEVLELLNKLEAGNKKVKLQFKKVVDICVRGQIKILSVLGIKYDYFDYESKYLWSKEINNILKKLEKTGKLVIDEEGRYVLNQEGFSLAMKSPVLVLTRADKTSLYPLRDTAYTIEKIEKGFERNILVLGEDQKLYFQQIKITLELLGYTAPEVIHYSFVLLQEEGNSSAEAMSTRQGNVVLLEKFINSAIEKAKDEIKKRGKISETALNKRTKIIANSAIKYSIIKVSPEKNVIFDLSRAVSFEGDTGPYLLYAYARICSILRKYKKKISKEIDFELLKENYEIELIKYLAEFQEVIDKATLMLRPHLIANYLYALAKKFNEFYHNCPVLKAEQEVMMARLLLISCVRQVLGNGLNLIGIEAVERM